jgi:hypothetical protein
MELQLSKCWMTSPHLSAPSFRWLPPICSLRLSTLLVCLSGSISPQESRHLRSVGGTGLLNIPPEMRVLGRNLSGYLTYQELAALASADDYRRRLLLGEQLLQFVLPVESRAGSELEPARVFNN